MDKRRTYEPHRKLIVWQRAMELALEAHKLAGRLPPRERRDLGGQIRRAALSVPANIAEGNGRHHRGDQARFLSIARGSLMELDTHLEIAVRTGSLRNSDTAKARALIENISLLLTRLTRAIHRAIP
jgi:four helix bundle protein